MLIVHIGKISLRSSAPCRELFQLFLKLTGQTAGEVHRLSGAGMEKPQAHSVQALALEAGNRPLGPVDLSLIHI